jgi:hypothetical protein
MPTPSPTGPQDIELDSSPRFETGWAHAKVVIIAILSLFILAGLAGVFGRGPLSRGSASFAGGRVEWERFARRQTPGELSVTFQPAPAASRELTLDRPFLDAFKVTAIEPRALSERATAAGADYRLPVGADGGRVTIAVEPSRAGLTRGSLRIDQARIPVTALIWP